MASARDFVGYGERPPRAPSSVGLHCRIAGRSGRAVAIRRFIEYATSPPGVWVARRIDIARAWTSAFA